MASLPELELELEDNDLLRMLQEPLSPLTVLSISAIITTISLFFCGIPICMQIYRRRSTHEISGFPFLMGFLGGAFWLRYGLLKVDLTMVTVNVVGVSLMFLYMLFYLYYSRPRTSFLLKLSIVFSMVAVMLVFVHIYQMDSQKQLGFVCMTFNILNFGAPLAGLTVVLRNRCCSTLPLPLCTANLLVSSQWCVYGVCVNDIFIIIPNGAGVLLALLQISLFLIFPRKEGTHAPLSKCCQCVLDLEKAEGLMTESGRRREKRENVHHRTLTPRNKFLHRQRVIDRRMIPESRAACIEYLRTGGAFDASFGSVSSRATADSWISGNSISRISSSISHPELFASVQQAIEDGDGQQQPPYLFMDENGGIVMAGDLQHNHQHHHQPSIQQSQVSVGPGTSLLSTTIGPNASLSASRPTGVGFGDVVFGGIREETIDENQLLTEDRSNGDLLFVRTLSAPDLLTQLTMRNRS